MTQVSLDHISDKFLLLAEKRRELKRLEAEVAKLDREVRAEVGTAEEATVFGEVVVTNHFVNKFREGQFKKDNPVLWKEFSRRVSRTEFDAEWFRSAHPNLYEQYQSRQFLYKVSE